jgi:asparagine synthetase B (glutamine-hydrolysing)
VLHAYLQWGEAFTRRLNGMYAFALWDPREEQLLLVRDRMGIKPLYYYPTPDGVLFGSEPKAVLAHPAVRPTVDAEGLAELITFTKTPGHAVYKGMHEVLPGNTVRVDRRGLTARTFADLLEHVTRVLGPDHPDTLATRNNLAGWRGEAGDAAGAATAHTDLLADRMRVLGPDHHHTLATWGNLAYWRGRAEDAPVEESTDT